MGAMRIGIVGAGGRMGRTLIRALAEAGDAVALSGAADAPGSAQIGADAGTLAGVGPLGIAIAADPQAAFAGAEAVIDFTHPATTADHAARAAAAGAALVIGTTGLGADQMAALRAAAAQVPIVQAYNMSLGVNLLAALVRRAAAALDAGFDIEIVEMHHRHKIDAPSGTALLLGRAAAEGRGVDLDAVKATDRDGRRPEGAIGFATLRGGDVIGDHAVVFAGAGERIELTHRAGDRSLFAHGAVKAALWTRGRPPGLYSMADVLGLAD